MRDFVALYRTLDATTSTRAREAALAAWFARAAPADAAWSAWLLAGGKPRQPVPARVLRELAARRAGIPDWLFEECYQAVGDLAETIALLLPAAAADASAPAGEPPGAFSRWIEERLLALRELPREEADALVLRCWDELDATGRFVWNKLLTGGFRVGVSKQLVIRGIAAAAGIDPRSVAERFAGRWSPSAEGWRALVAADAGAGAADVARPYPFFLAHPLDAPPQALGPFDDWFAEWKWDGIRAQLVRRDGRTFVWSRGEELVTERFPEVVAACAALPDGTVLDGELLAWRDGRVQPFALLQKRIGRRAVGARLLAEAPVAFLTYDLLEDGGADVRDLPFDARRARLAARVAAAGDARLALSPAVEAADWEALAARRAESRARGVEGVMLKRRASRYGVGRSKGAGGGDWWKWKIEPYAVDAVLVYAQRGHGRRASLYTDYTFAVRDGDALVPFAKAYSGLSDAEIREVDAYVRAHTIEKFGPVRGVLPGLVCEIGFEAIQASPRHRSGIAVRFPRILRLRRDKRPEDADTLGALRALLAAAGSCPVG